MDTLSIGLLVVYGIIGILCFISLFFAIRNFVNHRRKGLQKMWYKEAGIILPLALFFLQGIGITNILSPGNSPPLAVDIIKLAFTVIGGVLAIYALLLSLRNKRKETL